MVAARLEVQPVSTGSRMHQQHIHLSGVPGVLILRALIHPDPQLVRPAPVILLQALQDAVLVVLVAVEREAMLPV